MERLFETLSLVNNPGIQEFLGIFRWGLGFIGLVLFLFCAVVLVRTAWLRFAVLFDATEFLTYRPYGMRRMTNRWEKLKSRLQTANEAEYKLAVIEADGMLNEVLQRMGFRGETLRDKLQVLTPAIVPNLSDVLKAHQTRNNIVHDPDFKLTLDHAKETLEIYEVSFRNLDLL